MLPSSHIKEIIKRSDIVRSNYIILGIILIICSSLFLVGCNREENKEISYEIISFENAPKEVQDLISKNDRIRKEKEREWIKNNSDSQNSTILSSGEIDLGKERYVYYMTDNQISENNNEIPKIIEVAPDKAYGRGIVIKFVTESIEENVEFPNTVVIVKFTDYYGKILQVKGNP